MRVKALNLIVALLGTSWEAEGGEGGSSTSTYSTSPSTGSSPSFCRLWESNDKSVLITRVSVNFHVIFINLPSACRLLDMKVDDKEFGGCESHGCGDDSCPASRGVGRLALFSSHLLSFYLLFSVPF